MFISRILIHNFRSLKKVDIQLQSGLNVLIGKNNVGKSNIIRAIDSVLGERYPTYREYNEKDFFHDGQGVSNAFWIIIRLEGNEVSFEAIKDVEKNVQLIEINKPKWDNFEEFVDNPENHYKNKNKKGNWLDYKSLLEKLKSSGKVYISLYIPKDSKRGDRSYNMFFEHDNIWFYIPTFANELKNALMTTAFIPSFRDPSSQLRINEYSWYGKLIRKLYDNKTEEQDAQIKQSHDTLARVLGNIFEETTDNLRSILSDAIFHNTLSFRAGANTKDDEHKQITLFVDDGIDTPFYEKGSGIQSALIIGLFTYYCQQFHEGNSLLLVEEPEIYLHPQARRAIQSQLIRFTETNSDSKKQVIISTHAPEFLRTVPLKSVICVRKTANELESQIYPKKLPDNKNGQIRRWEQILHTRNAEMLFADHVILVEGGEEYILYPLADLHFQKKFWFDMHNISVIRVNGKKQFREYVSILKEFDIGYTILADFDFIVDGINEFIDSIPNIKENYDRVKEFISQLSKPKAKKIKESLSPETRDWVNLYSSVENAVNILIAGKPIDENQISQIQNLWSSLKDRINKPNISILLQEQGIKSDIDKILNELQKINIFVLSNGELENYLTANSMKLDSSKDRRAIEVSIELSQCSTLDDIQKWVINYEEFFKIFEHVKNAIQK